MRLNYLLLAFSLCLSVFSSQAYAEYNARSNDPMGQIFIPKSFADISNCGPISALMLAKYINASFITNDLNADITKARKIVMKTNSAHYWWRMSDIKKYLQHMAIQYDVIKMHKTQHISERKKQLVSVIDNQGVALINIDMNNIPEGLEVGKAYGTFSFLGARWGHFLVIVGYKEINGKLVFEIHDSNNNKGKNRLFHADEIVGAISDYNPEVIFVKNTRTMDNLWASAKWVAETDRL